MRGRRRIRSPGSGRPRRMRCGWGAGGRGGAPGWGRPGQVEVYTDAPGARLSRVGYRTFGRASENLTLTRAAASTSGSGRTLLLTEVRNFGGTARRTTVRVAWPAGTVEAG